MTQRAKTPTSRHYINGFVWSLALTLVPFIFITKTTISGMALYMTVFIAAILQLCVQLVYFLHINHGRNRRWNIVSFGSMIIIVIIIVFGSLWIMNNLHYNMMPGHELTDYIQEEEAIDNHAHH